MAEHQSGPIDLTHTSDEDLQQLQQEWGYCKVGRPIPEGVTAGAIANTLPDDLYKLDMKQVTPNFSAKLHLYSPAPIFRTISCVVCWLEQL